MEGRGWVEGRAPEAARDASPAMSLQADSRSTSIDCEMGSKFRDSPSHVLMSSDVRRGVEGEG